MQAHADKVACHNIRPLLSLHCQVDILSSGDEVSEVVDFVRQNAVRLLGVEGPRVLPVSSRAAMEAKAAAAAAGDGECTRVGREVRDLVPELAGAEAEGGECA